MIIKKRNIFIVFIIVILVFQCVSSGDPGEKVSRNDILGFGFFNRIPGLWSGPVITDTPAGNFPVWYVDFRPVAPGQISQYTSIDLNTINYLSFFIVKHDNQLKLAMRTEGVFMNQGCVTYEVMEAADESKGYYKFSDFVAGSRRAYTEFTFTDNKLVMEVYTTKFNKLVEPVLHSRWEAVLADRSAAETAIEHFNYPQAEIVKDFSDVFVNLYESIYYDLSRDPYPSDSQPYVGTLTINVDISDNLPVKDDDELFILLTTESLFEGLTYLPENLKYFSKCIFVPIDMRTFTFKDIHPGTYYLYSYNDINGDKRHLSGDYFSSNIFHAITLEPGQNLEVNTFIDSVIP